MTSLATLAAGYMEKAERALDEARFLLGGDKTEGACSRAYYAMHDAAHAALFATGHETPDAIIKTHQRLIAAFGQKIVLGGQIDANLGRALNRVQDIRLLADYDASPPSLDDAEWCVEQAGAFVVAIRSLISRL
jgi:uncharacterized protein (UPF0332 family)